MPDLETRKFKAIFKISPPFHHDFYSNFVFPDIYISAYIYTLQSLVNIYRLKICTLNSQAQSDYRLCIIKQLMFVLGH